MPISLSPITAEWSDHPIFKKLGFKIERTGPRTARIDATPTCLPKAASLDVVDEIFDLLSQTKNNEKLEHATFIEKVTKRLNRKVIAQPSKDEVQALLQEVFATPASKQNPLYHRALYALDQNQLSQLFG